MITTRSGRLPIKDLVAPGRSKGRRKDPLAELWDAVSRTLARPVSALAATA